MANLLEDDTLRAIKQLRFGSLVLLYVVVLGIFQFIATLFGADVTLQTPMVLLIYAGVFYLFIPLLTSNPKDFATRVLENNQFFWVVVILTVLIFLTPFLLPEIIPSMFVIIGP